MPKLRCVATRACGRLPRWQTAIRLCGVYHVIHPPEGRYAGTSSQSPRWRASRTLARCARCHRARLHLLSFSHHLLSRRRLLGDSASASTKRTLRPVAKSTAWNLSRTRWCLRVHLRTRAVLLMFTCHYGWAACMASPVSVVTCAVASTWEPPVC